MVNDKTDLTAVILTKNEAETIEGCINSVKSLNPLEILVLDDESSDNTRELAQKQGARVIIHKKINFSEARNFGLKQTKSRWILYVDADERLSPELSGEIKQVIPDSGISAYRLVRQNYYLGKKWPALEKIIRLFEKDSLVCWFGEVHESPQVKGEVGELKFPLYHYTHKTLAEMVTNTLVWSEIEAELRFKAHHPGVVWWRFPRVMLPVFWDYYIRQGGWRVGSVGLIESIYQAFSIFITYAKLWEMQNQNKFKRSL